MMRPCIAQVVTIGVVGGANGTSLAGDRPRMGSFNMGGGYQVGGLVGISVGPNIVFDVQVLYVSASPKLEIKIDEDEPTVKQKLQFDFQSVAIPITVQYVFGAARTRAFIGTGAQLGFLQSATLKEVGQADVDIGDALESFNASVLLDFGVKSKLRWANWFVQGRIAIGFVDVASGDPLDTGRGETIWKTRSVQLLAGFSYSFGN
jgi:hypothetical protein